MEKMFEGKKILVLGVANKKSIAWGIMGNVSDVPDGYNMETIVFYSPNGINRVYRFLKHLINKL